MKNWEGFKCRGFQNKEAEFLAPVSGWNIRWPHYVAGSRNFPGHHKPLAQNFEWDQIPSEIIQHRSKLPISTIPAGKVYLLFIVTEESTFDQTLSKYFDETRQFSTLISLPLIYANLKTLHSRTVLHFFLNKFHTEWKTHECRWQLSRWMCIRQIFWYLLKHSKVHENLSIKENHNNPIMKWTTAIANSLL